MIQDAVWEQSFPAVGGIAIPFEGAGLVRLSEAEAERRREANEERRRSLLYDLRALDLDPVLVSSHERHDVFSSFLTWADQRLFTRGRA